MSNWLIVATPYQAPSFFIQSVSDDEEFLKGRNLTPPVVLLLLFQLSLDESVLEDLE
jgi:hypothetical protein